MAENENGAAEFDLVQLFDPINYLYNKNVYSLILEFLPISDLKNLRLVSHFLNETICRDTKFPRRVTGVIKTKWYKDAKKADLDMSSEFLKLFRWRQLKFFHFKYYKKITSFKNFWNQTSFYLTNLTLSHSTLGCDGFFYILEKLVNLETLHLENLKIRNFYNAHNCPINERRPIASKLKELSMDKIWMFEDCCLIFLRYFIRRLETLKIKSCFFDSEGKVREHETAAEFDRIKTCLVNLITSNLLTLKKFHLEDTKHNTGILAGIVQFLNQNVNIERGFRNKIEEFHFSTNDVEPEVNIISVFLQQARLLKNLKMRLNWTNNLQPEHVTTLLDSTCQGLLTLSLSLNGKHELIAGDEVQLLELSRQISRFDALQKLTLRDERKLDLPDERRMIWARKNMERNQDYDIEQWNRLKLKNFSKWDFGFLQNLPNTLNEIKIRAYSDDPHLQNLNFGQVPNQGNAINFYLNLTRFEMEGPTFMKMYATVGVIIKEMKNLITLRLANCGVTDESLMGISRRLARDLYHSDAVTRVYDRPAEAHRIIERCSRRFSTLRNLKNLDLSGNYDVTNVTCTYVIRNLNIENLIINNCPNISNIGLKLLGRYCPSLKRVEAKNLRRISPSGIDILIQSCPNLAQFVTTKVIGEVNELEYPLTTPYAQYKRIVTWDIRDAVGITDSN